ncbi:MAG TPA: Hsp20/alpha crystallin family protein [Firmicutes bacterium]|nr:Hsp20/alpha crystallin family protein [Bacillota bacterium]
MLPSIFGENLFDEFFNDAFDDSFFSGKNPLYGRHAKNLMKTDIKEHKNCYKIAVDLPGFKKDEIKVKLKDGYLTVSAAKGLDKDEEDKGRFIRRERYAGACSRSFYVGDVTNDEIKCKFEFGVLTITLPKRDKKAVDGSSRIMIE